MEIIKYAKFLADAVEANFPAFVRGGVTVDLMPDFDLRKIKELQIVVFPGAYSTAIESRNSNLITITYKIGFMEHIERHELENKIELVENLATKLLKKHLGDGEIKSVEYNPIYEVDALLEMSVFLSICEVTIEVELDE